MDLRVDPFCGRAILIVRVNVTLTLPASTLIIQPQSVAEPHDVLTLDFWKEFF